MFQISRYAHWLHTQWPAGTVERLPVVNPDGSTAVPGVFIVGDLAGIPLLKFSADSGARAVRTIASRLQPRRPSGVNPLDLIIIGGGVSGLAAALEAKKLGLSYKLVESTQTLSTILNFPKAKPIYTYPIDMVPAGDLQFSAKMKEPLIEEIQRQTKEVEVTSGRATRVIRKDGVLEVELAQGPPLRATHVIIAIGRSGEYRKLNVPGEDLPKVYNRLHDPKDYAGQDVLVVGGGDSALESAIALSESGARVTLSYRKPEFARPKPENLERIASLVGVPASRGSMTLLMSSQVKAIDNTNVTLIDSKGNTQTISNDVVFTMIGREAPLEFLRKSGITIAGDRTVAWWITLGLAVLVFLFAYHWKKGGVHITGYAPIDYYLDIGSRWQEAGLFPYNVPELWGWLGGWFADKTTLLGTMKVSVGEPGFWFSLLYCVAIVVFGFRRIRRRRTPYITIQTWTLAVIQVLPLFLLPYIVLPWLGNNGAFDGGWPKWLADELFPSVSYGQGREYWRAFGLILAWPLFIWNVFTAQPMWLWLAISLVQTFIVIPLIIFYWGKGAYCGWICSCGALAETVGDMHRTKMPHGPLANRLNFIGQVFLFFALVLLVLRVTGWIFPKSVAGTWFDYLLFRLPILNYVWLVDLMFAGVIGVGLYWHFSGRVWCRFACPLAALMHIYARFSRFAIISDKKKCISCNVCTSVCHQGIDVMNFANKGNPMVDPQCVRCSACVQSCPTSVLSFGQLTRAGDILRLDPEFLAASPVQMKVRGKAV